MRRSKVDRDLTCRELVELVTDYLDGALPAAERMRFESHMAACEGCERYVEQIRATIALAGASGEPSRSARRSRRCSPMFRDYRRRL